MVALHRGAKHDARAAETVPAEALRGANRPRARVPQFVRTIGAVRRRAWLFAQITRVNARICSRHAEPDP
jgi:hypothetical protein